MRRPAATVLLAALACSGGSSSEVPGITGLGGSTGASGESSASATPVTGSADPTSSTTQSAPPTTDTSGADSTDSGDVSEQDCVFTADDFGAPMQELDVELGSPQRLVFTIRGLPPPAAVTSATLRFDSHDADHPGEEGTIWVNGDGPFDLPANAAWDNVDSTGSLDVSGATVEGDNVIEFGAGSFDGGTFYRIGNVELAVQATVETCPEAPAMERTVMFTDAIYSERHNWVLRCEAGFEYAYTARSDEHIDLDCDGLYAPDGTRSGTATFRFEDVTAADYEVQIRSRHTANRNPMGALFVVDGVSVRIPQNDEADYTTDVWGEARLEGSIDVVLDSTMENESDSVIWVRLVPQ